MWVRFILLIAVLLNKEDEVSGRYDFEEIEKLNKNDLEESSLEDIVLRGLEDDVLEVPDSVWDEEANYTATHPYLGSRGIVDDVITVPDAVWEEEDKYTSTHSGQKYIRQFGSNLPAPTGTCLSIKVVYDRNWVNQAGGGNAASGLSAANSVIAQVQGIYNWNSLKCGSSNSACRIQLQLSQQPVYEQRYTWYASESSLRSTGVRQNIGGSNIDHHVFLGGRDGGGAIGIAWLGTACIRSPRDYTYKTSISEWTGSTLEVARTVAHEIGHALRMYHDFDYPNRADRQGRPCTGINSIMDYTRNENKWSPCSTQAFRDFYNRELSTKRFFCMQKSCNGVVPSAVPTVEPPATPCTDRITWCPQIVNSWLGPRLCGGQLGERLCKKSCNRC